MIIKTILSLILGALVGYDREKYDKPAGLRTIMLVCLGTTVFTHIGMHLLATTHGDGIRLLYACVLGIGFLGSGVIIKKDENTEGITTAGVLWGAVALGMLCGLGWYIQSIVVAIEILAIVKLKHLIADKNERL